MKKRKLSAHTVIDQAIARTIWRPEPFMDLLTLEGAGETLVGGAAVTPVADASQTGDVKPMGGVEKTEPAVGETKPEDKLTPTAAEAEATAKAEAEAKAKTDAEAAEKTALKAPEKYEFKMPEGVTLDVELIGEFEDIARELDLPQESAQKVADLGVKLQQKFVTQQAAALDKLSAEWAAQSRSDAEYGGDKFNENMSVVAKVREAFISPAMRKVLDESKLGNHPEFIRMCVKFGKAMSEDKLVTGGNGPSADKSTANVLYPNQK